MKKYRFDVWGVSDAGIQKSVNQDAFVYKVVDTGEHYAAMVAVADGVGGLQEGEKASALAIARLNLWWENSFQAFYACREDMLGSLLHTVQKINDDLYTQAAQAGVQTGTTIAILILYKEEYITFHVGDSRVYKIHGKKTACLTEDHSRFLARELDGKIYGKYVLTSCLGYNEQFEHSTNEGAIKKEDFFLVCSDGVYKTLPDGEIAARVTHSKKQVQRGCQALVDAAKEQGETDNITAALVRVTK